MPPIFPVADSERLFLVGEYTGLVAHPSGATCAGLRQGGMLRFFPESRDEDFDFLLTSPTGAELRAHLKERGLDPGVQIELLLSSGIVLRELGLESYDHHLFVTLEDLGSHTADGSMRVARHTDGIEVLLSASTVRIAQKSSGTGSSMVEAAQEVATELDSDLDSVLTLLADDLPMLLAFGDGFIDRSTP